MPNERIPRPSRRPVEPLSGTAGIAVARTVRARMDIEKGVQREDQNRGVYFLRFFTKRATRPRQRIPTPSSRPEDPLSGTL
jgi:hypothetical protein